MAKISRVDENTFRIVRTNWDKFLDAVLFRNIEHQYLPLIVDFVWEEENRGKAIESLRVYGERCSACIQTPEEKAKAFDQVVKEGKLNKKAMSEVLEKILKIHKEAD